MFAFAFQFAFVSYGSGSFAWDQVKPRIEYFKQGLLLIHHVTTWTCLRTVDAVFPAALPSLPGVMADPGSLVVVAPRARCCRL